MRTIQRSLLAAALVAAGLSLAAGEAGANDRQLLRSGTGDPLVMILFDTSGSMNWSPKCTAEQVADGICTFLCPTGDCPTPRNGDDPASKFRQAKEALYEVLRAVDNINFGFATYNQDQLRTHFKEWLYQVEPVQADGFFTLAGGDAFPAAGTDEVFGAGFGCDRGAGDAEIGCYANGDDSADTGDLWEMTKVRRLPKLGDNLGSTVSYYVRSGGQVYWVRTFNPPSVTQALGDASMALRTELYSCTGTPADNPTNGCNSNGERSLVASKDITYRLVGDFVKWENRIDRNPEQGGFDAVAMSGAGNTCAGWDPNEDGPPFGTADNYNGYTLKQPNLGLFFDPPGTADDWKFRRGDVLPLNWLADQKGDVLNRLAPRLNGGDPVTDPEAFAVATYLEDHPAAGEDFLRVSNNNQRPLFPAGSTPLGWSLKSIREWFRGCENGSCPNDLGWDDVAAVQDPDWECRQKYLLVITDGDDTCAGRDPCSLTASMHSLDDITTYVVAFGVENTAGNRLNCMASNGGSGEPIYPQNKQELIDALTAIFGEIQEEAVAFASAAVPSVQANIADKIYLSSFTPLNESSVWPGRLDAFLKPLPVDADGLPDRTGVCQPGVIEAECFAWDAGDSQGAWDGDAGYAPRGLLLQAPLLADITRFDNSTLDIGTAADERRVYFGLPASTTAGKRQYFRYPESTAEQAEFEFVWNLPNPGVGDATNRTTIAGIVEFTVAEKQGQATDPDTGLTTQLQYVMGDIFHANPTVLNSPGDFDFYTKDLYWNTPLCGDTDVAQTRLRGPQISYSWFANKHLCRRIMLFAGSNDGQIHAFDGGIFRGNECKLDLPASLRARDATLADSDTTDGRFDIGSGRELFSFIPGAQMPLVKQLSEINSLTTQYGVDNTPRVADVFIDPVLDVSGNSACVDRQWRTVLLGSYREGGPGIFALDITQPDVVNTGTNIPEPLAGFPNYVPSCADGGANCGPLPFPSLLWEFQDSNDEDAVGGPDLGETWSRPVVARIRVCDGACDTDAEPEDRFVAVFGGGLPESPSNSSADTQGNWIYMVDIETGRILYKRGGNGVIEGAVPGDIALLDANVNGIAETLYFGTTAGFVYKLNLGEGPFNLGGDGRIQDPTGEAGRYTPFKAFTTGGLPIYMEVNLVYVAKLRQYALLFGTGNRWNLWDFGGQVGRFYVAVDNGWKDGGLDGATFDGLIDPIGCASCTQPLTEAVLQPIDPDSAFDIENPGPSYLFGNPDTNLLAGWYFPLEENEKLITEPFTLSGITFFTIYDPISSAVDGACALGGESKIFIVNTVNAVGYVPAGTGFERYSTAPKFTTQPFAESSATQNPGGSGNNADTWTESLRTINRELKELQPSTCRFANYTIDIKTIRSDTGIVFVAPVPVCIEGHNWKEY